MRVEIKATPWSMAKGTGEKKTVYTGEQEHPTEEWFTEWVEDYLAKQGEEYRWPDDMFFSLYCMIENGWFNVKNLWASEVQGVA